MSHDGAYNNLTEVLVAEPQVLGLAQLERAKEAASRKRCSLFESLINEQIIAEQNLLDVLSERLGLEKIDIIQRKPEKKTLKLVPAELAVKKGCIPVKVDKHMLLVAVSDPTDYELYDELKLLLYANQQNGELLEPTFCLAEKEAIYQAIKNNCY